MSPFEPDVIYEDNHLLVVNKPAGMLTQADDTGQPNLLEGCRQWLKIVHHKPGNVFLEAVHRLDKPVSGIVLFAKTSKALSRLNASMRSKNVRKTYIAQVAGTPPQTSATLAHYLVHGSHKASISSSSDPQAKEARLHYKVIGKEKNYTLLEIELETGRYHQIRIQCAAMGCPIVGDQKYGGPPRFDGDGIALHHAMLAITHPISSELLTFKVIPPFHQPLT